MPFCSYPELASVMDSHVMEAITFAKISSSGSLLRKKVNLYEAYIKHLKGLLQGSFYLI